MAETSSWADRVADELQKTKRKTYVCEGMWAPSGYFHIGNARPEIFVPFSVTRTLHNRGLKAEQNFIIDDFDGIIKIPPGLGIKKEDESKFLNKPCALAPSPVEGYKSWAEYFISNVRESLPKYGVKLNIISAYETYVAGEFNAIIIQALNNSKKIVEVWNRVSGADKSENFIPVQMICEVCGGILTTTAKAWDGKEVSYSCTCSHEGKASPLNGKAKLHWRVHWVAHWILHDVAFESGGKDHFSKGGSVDVGRALIKEVFNKEPPYQIPTEFLQLKGAKMSGSVGNTISLSDWLEIASPESFRFLIFTYRPGKVIEFDFKGNSLPLLMARYEQAERIYYQKEKPKTEKIGEALKKAYKLSRLTPPPKEMPFQLLFSTAIQISQHANPKENPKRALEKVTELKGNIPKNQEKEILAKLINARNWVDKYAPQKMKTELTEKIPGELKSLPKEIKFSLAQLSTEISTLENPTEESIQNKISEIAEKNNAQKRDLFRAIYLALTGKERGPRASSLIHEFGIKPCAKRLLDASK